MSGAVLRSATSLRGSVRAALLVATVVVVASAPARPQTTATPTDLWIPLVETGTVVTRNEVETVFVEVLGGPSGPTHIAGLAGILDVVGRTGFALPACYEGLDICSDDVEAIARGLGADRVIYVRAQPRNGEVLRVTLVDIELGERVSLEVTGDDLREAIFAAVSAVTNASAHVTIRSEPTGAQIYLDGVHVGVTPYESTLGIGSYDLRLTYEGYYDYGSPIELRSGDVRTETVALERRYAEVLVETDAPGAEVVVDGTDVFPANAPFRLLPGERLLEIRAPGYDSTQRTLELVAGEERSYRVTLVESEETIARRKLDTILARPLALQLGFAGAGFRTDWADARVRLGGDRRHLECPVDPALPNAGCLDRTPVGAIGADLAVLYDWRWFQVELSSLGVHRTRLRTDRTTYAVRETGDLVTGSRGLEFVWGLPALGVRWQIDQDWSVFARTGPAAAFQRFEAEREPGGNAVRVRRTDWLWRIVAGGRYHISGTFFAFGEVGAGVALDTGETRARLGATLGLGLHLADRVGVQSRLEGRHQERETTTPDAPEEL